MLHDFASGGEKVWLGNCEINVTVKLDLLTLKMLRRKTTSNYVWLAVKVCKSFNCKMDHFTLQCTLKYGVKQYNFTVKLTGEWGATWFKRKTVVDLTMKGVFLQLNAM